MKTLAIMLALQLGTADAKPPKFLQDLGNMFSASAGDVNRHCKDPVSAVEAFVAANGAISGDNIKKFTDLSDGPRPQPDTALQFCLEVGTKPGSKLEVTQREMAMKLLDMAVAKHMVIDDVGDGRSYYGPGQGFYNDKPFEANHNACNEMDPVSTEKAYKETYLLQQLQTVLEAAARHPDVLAAIEGKMAELVAQGKAKSDACLATKLDTIKPYVDGGGAATAVKKDWEATARQHFAQFSDLKILRVVFFESQWRVTKKQTWDDYNKTWTPVHFKAMDLIVYVDNGEFADGYYMTVVHDFIRESDYLTFPYAEGVGKLPEKPHQRLLMKNL